MIALKLRKGAGCGGDSKAARSFRPPACLGLEPSRIQAKRKETGKNFHRLWGAEIKNSGFEFHWIFHAETSWRGHFSEPSSQGFTAWAGESPARENKIVDGKIGPEIGQNIAL